MLESGYNSCLCDNFKDITSGNIENWMIPILGTCLYIYAYWLWAPSIIIQESQVRVCVASDVLLLGS